MIFLQKSWIRKKNFSSNVKKIQLRYFINAFCVLKIGFISKISEQSTKFRDISWCSFFWLLRQTHTPHITWNIFPIPPFSLSDLFFFLPTDYLSRKFPHTAQIITKLFVLFHILTLLLFQLFWNSLFWAHINVYIEMPQFW